VVPLEFVYDHDAPNDDAVVCKGWLEAAKKGRWPEVCDPGSTGSVCPTGFWGLQKVIERHAVTPHLAKDSNVLYLQSEVSRQSDILHLGGTVVLGSSVRVPDPDVVNLEKLIARHCGAAPTRATNWVEWEEHVTKQRPNLLIALPHTAGRDTNVTLEIGNVTKKTITLKDTHVFPPPLDGRQAPLVALIGCDTAGTADAYGNHVRVLRARGAGIVIGTIATVFGKHAAAVAGKLVEGMLPDKNSKPLRLGELMRKIKRDSLMAGMLMPLCLVAYGDADWLLSRKQAPDA
jgi:hypothetical protein